MMPPTPTALRAEHRGRLSVSLALLLAFLMALPSALGANAEEPAPTSPYGSLDGVTYYLVAGQVNGSALASNPGTGDVLLDFAGCAFVQMRPELDRGRVSIAGFVDGSTPLRVDVHEFSGDVARQGPIAANLTLDPTTHPLLPTGQTARGEVAGKATAEMFVDQYIDFTATPLPRLRMANFTDPVGGGDELVATVTMAKDGLRDDATGALLDAVARDDEELHIVLSSPPGASPQSDRATFQSSADLPDGSLSADAEHVQAYEFLNTRFGGKATIVVAMQSKAPPGFNAVTVTVRAPDGSEAGNASVQSSALGDGSATIAFDADQMGFYSILVTGQVLLGSYRVDLQLDAPPAFRLDFWWEDVVRGDAAPDAFGECQRGIGLRADAVPIRIGRSQPPAFPLEVVIVAIVAAAATALLVVKLAADQVSASAFRKLKK